MIKKECGAPLPHGKTRQEVYKEIASRYGRTAVAVKKMAQTPTSLALSKDFNRRGWTFVGPTTAYAFMQAMGLVNDHVEGCHVRKPAEAKRRSFRVPSAKR